MQWSKEEDNILIQNYQLKKEEILKLLPARTESAIRIRASNLGLKKEKNAYLCGDVSVLLEENLESYYWVGFILADGSIIKNRLKVSLSVKDEEHLISLANFLKCKNIYKRSSISGFTKKEYNYVELSIQDKFYMPKIREKFDIKPIKTYNPPETYIEDFDKFMALFIGYIDGDGYIKKIKNTNISTISIQIHSSWLNFLQYFYDLVANHLNIINSNKAKIDKRGYAFLEISNSKIYKFLKIFAINNRLPVLSRKWEKIDENYTGLIEQSEINKKNVLNLYKLGFNVAEICKKIHLSKVRVYEIIREEKLENE